VTAAWTQYEVVILREKDLVRDERPLLPTEVRPPPPIPSLILSLPETEPVPEVQTPVEGGAPSGELEEMVTTGELEALPVAPTSPPVSALPPLERGQRTRQPPAYLKDFVCDCVQSGTYESLEGNRTGKISSNCGSCQHHGNINFYIGGTITKIHPPGVQSPSHAPQPRCSIFSYADAVKSSRASSH